MRRLEKARGLASAFADLYTTLTLISRITIFHLGHEEALIRQDLPRFLLRIICRYEHILMRVINYMASRDWIYRFDITKKIVDHLSRRIMTIANGEVMTIDETLEMLDSIFGRGYTVAVGTCPCRRALNRITDNLPNNTDMVFGRWAEEYLHHYPGLYHQLDRAEAKELVESFDQHGFIHQVYGFHSREAAAYVLCNCDPGICIPLNAQKERGYQAFRKGRALSVVDRDACLGIEECGICIDRCPFDARVARGEKSEVETDLCFGCGLCVATCRGKATRLERKEGARLVYARYLVS